MIICMLLFYVFVLFFFFKQKTAYEMRISDWSSDVCSSDLDAELSHLCQIVYKNDKERYHEEIGFGGYGGVAHGCIGTRRFYRYGKSRCPECTCQGVPKLSDSGGCRVGFGYGG